MNADAGNLPDAPRYFVKWNGCAWAVHDRESDWNVSVHATYEEACAALVAKIGGKG